MYSLLQAITRFAGSIERWYESLMLIPRKILFLLLFLTYLPSAYAEKSHLEYKNTVVLKGNPSTLLTIPSLSYRLEFSSAQVGISIRPLISITQFRPGLDLEISPFPYLKILAGYERAYYLQSLFTFRNASSDWSDGSRSRSSGISARADFFHASLHAKIPIKSFIFRNQFKLSYAKFDVQGNDEIVYDELLDIPLPIEGLSYTNEFDALYVPNSKWIFGLRYTTSKALVDEDPNGSTHRVGPLVSHVFYAKHGALVDSISGFILLNWYIKHRFRTGLEVSPLLPYSAIGFTVTGTFL